MYLVDSGVLKLVFLLTVEHHAVIVYEIENAGFPERTAEKLDDEVVLPFLTHMGDTS
jgi:hypothetical protein